MAPPPSIEEYQVGWVCALHKELTAARALLDEEYEAFKSRVASDDNSYVLGRIHEHHVVIACLPAGRYGTVSASQVATNMFRTFTGIRFGLMVGIGGGIPNLEKGDDIRLGDVVVSQPDGTHGGVVQYDLRKNPGEGIFKLKVSLSPPPTLLLTALANLRSQHEMHGNQISGTLSEMIARLPRLAKLGYVLPGLEKDSLHCSNIEGHKEGSICTLCQNGVIRREPREEQSPEVHYGVIASGNELMKNAVERDRLGREFGAKCVEMEAAGLMNDFPCIVIRGIYDHADRYKNDRWQEYAAATAAAFARELLRVVKPTDVATTKHATETMKYGLNLFKAPVMGEGFFIGRDAELQQMASILQPQPDSADSMRKVLILGGMGGIGKTQLAIAYAKRYRDSYSSVFWLNATSEATLKSSLRDVARRMFSETVSKLDDDQLLVRVSNWLSEPANTRWLLILDNYDDPDHYKIESYYPYVQQGSIVITTRRPEQLSGEKIKVGSMTLENDGLAILATRSERQQIESDVGAQKLVRRLDGLPLALATVGAFLKNSRLSFAQYLELYEAKWNVSGHRARPLREYTDRTLYTTWNISFTQIEQQDPDAAQLLKLLAYFDHQDIRYEMLEGGSGDSTPPWFVKITHDVGVFESVIAVLVGYCLVESRSDAKSYGVHICVHDWLVESLNQTPDISKYSIALSCVDKTILQDDWETLSDLKYRNLTRHATRIGFKRFRSMLFQQDFAAQNFRKIFRIAELLRQQEKHMVSELMYKTALVGYESSLGLEDTGTIAVIFGLGLLYQDRGQLDEAERIFQRALAGYEKALGPEHTSTLGIVNNLGVLYRQRSELAQAEAMYQRALAGYEKALGPEHTSTLIIVNNLGILYSKQGKLTQAEAMYQRALAGKEKALGLEHMSTLTTVNNLGILCSEQGKLAQAESMYQKALAGSEKALGPEHTSTLDIVSNLGNLYSNQGKLTQAEAMYQRALAGREKALSPEHTSTLDIVNNLGILYSKQGKLTQAEAMYQRALAGYEKASLSYNIPAMNTLYNLGLLYRDQDKIEDARKMFQRSLAGREKVLGLDDSRTLKVVNILNELTSVVEANQKEDHIINSSHGSKRTSVRWKSLLRLSSSKTSQS